MIGGRFAYELSTVIETPTLHGEEQANGVAVTYGGQQGRAGCVRRREAGYVQGHLRDFGAGGI